MYGLQNWMEIEAFGIRPHTSHTFLEKASLGHRYFQSLFLSSCLRSSTPSEIQLTNVQRGFCLSIWLGSLLEYESEALGYYLTHVLSQLTIFRDVFDGMAWKEKHPSVHEMRDGIATILKRVMEKERNVMTVSYVFNRLYKVFLFVQCFSKRYFEVLVMREEEIKNSKRTELEKMKILQKWTVLTIAFLNLKFEPQMAQRHFGTNWMGSSTLLREDHRQQLITLCFTWMNQSVVFLQATLENFLHDCRNKPTIEDLRQLAKVNIKALFFLKMMMYSTRR